MDSHAEQTSAHELRRDIDECICIGRCELKVAYRKIELFEQTLDKTKDNITLRKDLDKKRQKLLQAISLINDLEISPEQAPL